MPDVSRERVGLLVYSLFKLLAKESEGLPAGEALRRLAKAVTLTDYEAGEYESGGKRYDKIVRFGTIGTVKAGWLVKQKGRWSLTDEGRSALARYSESSEFFRESERLYRQWRKAQPDANEESTEETTESVATVTFEQAEEQAWEEIKAFLRAMPPYDFQELVASLLKAMSYHVSWVAPPGKDGGIDIVAATDPLGTRPPRIKVQVKRHASNIPVESLRAFMAMLGDNDVGLFVTTSAFTRDAQDEARVQERRRITLIDLEGLVDLWVQHYDKLDETAKRRLPLKPIYFLAPEV